MSGGEWQSAVSARGQKKKAKAAERNKQRDAAIKRLQEAKEEELALIEKKKREKMRDNHRIGIGKGGQITFSLEGTSSDAAKKKATRKRSKGKKQTAVKESKQSVSISPGRLEKVIATSEAQYDDALLQQREVVSFIEEQLNKVKKFDPNNHTASFETVKDRPLSYMKQPTQAALSKWIRKQPSQSLQTLLWFLLAQVASTTTESVTSNGNGIRAVIQLILRNRSGVLYKDKERFKQEMKRYTVQVRKADLLLTVHPLRAGQTVVTPSDVGLFSWVFAQVLDSSPREALGLWMAHVQPHIGCRLAVPNALKAVVDVGFAAVAAVAREEGLQALKMDTTVFADGVERLLVLARTQQSGRLPALYFGVRDLSVLGDSGVPQLFLSTYLAHLEDEDETSADGLQEEALGTLVKMVTVSPACCDALVNAYGTHMVQANVLLKAIVDDYAALSFTDDAKAQLDIAVRSIIGKNSQLAGTSCKLATGKSVKFEVPGAKRSTQTCRKLLALSGPHWLGTLLFHLFHWLLAAYVVYAFAGRQILEILDLE